MDVVESNPDVENAELELRKGTSNSPATSGEIGSTRMSIEEDLDLSNSLQDLCRVHLTELINILLTGVDNWTVETRKKYITGLGWYLRVCEEHISPVLPVLFASLSAPIRDEEVDIRVATEKTCQVIGSHVLITHVLDLLIPRVRGEVSGTDTSSHREFRQVNITFPDTN